jgi:hypothetical protein
MAPALFIATVVVLVGAVVTGLSLFAAAHWRLGDEGFASGAEDRGEREGRFSAPLR